MNNLVIGSEGFVGKPLCKFLEDLGEGVSRFDIQRSIDEDARYNTLPLKGIDRVYFLAWDVGGAKYLYNQNSQLPQLKNNCRLLNNVMGQLEQFDVPFLFVSTQLAEHPNMVYGATKRLGELWTLSQKRLCLRLWNVYGPDKPPSLKSHLVEDLVFQAVQKREIKLLTDGEESRQFIHIDDVCRAFRSGMGNNLNGLFDVSTHEWIKVKDVAKIVSDITGAKLIVGQEKGIDFPTSFKELLPSWSPKVSLCDGIEILVKKVQKNHSTL